MRALQVFGSIVDSKNGIYSLGWNTKKRCEETLKLLKRANFDLLVLSGGAAGEATAAAILMHHWFLEKGVKIEMLVDHRSCDSWQNVEFSLRLLGQMYPDKRIELHVISHWMHVLRLWVIYRLGYKRRVRIHPLWYSAHWKYLIKGLFTLGYTILNPKGTEEGLIGRPLKNSADRKEFHRRSEAR